ncbi:uncharacterized protein LOC144737358 isoform X2 [Lampetra planeri]
MPLSRTRGGATQGGEPSGDSPYPTSDEPSGGSSCSHTSEGSGNGGAPAVGAQERPRGPAASTGVQAAAYSTQLVVQLIVGTSTCPGVPPGFVWDTAPCKDQYFDGSGMPWNERIFSGSYPLHEAVATHDPTLVDFVSSCLCLSERYEEEMAVNSGRRLVQRYEQEKSRLAEGLLHPRLHGWPDDKAATERPNHQPDGRPPPDRQPTGTPTEHSDVTRLLSCNV